MQYNDKHCKFYFDMQKYSCGARCNQDDIDPFYVEKRPWKTYWNPYVHSSNTKLFELDKFKNLCRTQRRRISLMMSSGCDYCLEQLAIGNTNSLPLPHLLLDMNLLNFQSFLSNGSFHFNHPLFCPRVLDSNQVQA